MFIGSFSGPPNAAASVFNRGLLQVHVDPFSLAEGAVFAKRRFDEDVSTLRFDRHMVLVFSPNDAHLGNVSMDRVLRTTHRDRRLSRPAQTANCSLAKLYRVVFGVQEDF